MTADEKKLELWERIAKAICRAYTKLPMSKHNEKLNAELGELVQLCRDLEPSLQSFYAMD